MRKEKKGGIFKYLITILIFILIIWLGKKYLHYERFNPPTNYTYTINDSIDIYYHNPLVVQNYYENVYRLSSFANEQWFNYEIDVQFPDHENPQSVLANETFLKMIASTKHMEAILKNSKDLKSKGLDNKSIQKLEETGLSVEKFKLQQKFSSLTMTEGDFGEHVKYLQIKLNELGYEIPVTGLYKDITTKSVIDFQNKNDLFPTGTTNEETLILLFNNK